MANKSSYFVECPQNYKESQGRRFKMVPDDSDEDAQDEFKVYVKVDGEWVFLGKIDRDRGRNVTSGYANIATSWTEPYEYNVLSDANGEYVASSYGQKKLGAVSDLLKLAGMKGI